MVASQAGHRLTSPRTGTPANHGVMDQPFVDRIHAGTELAAALHQYSRPNPVVLALPRGGLPVAEPVAQALEAVLDVLVVRKIGSPGNPEFAVGAIGEDGVEIIDRRVQLQCDLSDEGLRAIVVRERRELDRRLLLYRAGRPSVSIADRNVIVVDDGLATGRTARAAIEVARRRGAAHITLAVPVGSREAVAQLAHVVDDIVCLRTPASFASVGENYMSFQQVTDEEVTATLERHPLPAHGERRSTTDEDVRIDVHGITLPGHLMIPARPHGVVVFAHGSGSGHASPRNSQVAHLLQCAGIGTLLVDLALPGEDEALDMDALARRFLTIAHWISRRDEVRGRPIGALGSSSGAAVALQAAAEEPDLFSAVVSRGGRPDLAWDWLPLVMTPTLLIVGGHDTTVLTLNQRAAQRLRCPHLIEVVPGASHLFEEPGTLAQAARLAQTWFAQHFASVPV